MLIYLMRHGETDWNKAGRFQGQQDVPLNENGIELAVKTAEGLKNVNFDAAFSSPLQRALVTARTVIGSRNIEVQTDERLRELCFGPSEGECSDLAKGNPMHPMYSFLFKPDCYAPTAGAESLDHARKRAEEFL